MAVRRFSGRRSASLKTWLGQISPSFGIDITPAAGLISPGLKVFGSPQDEDYTILRTRGNMLAQSVTSPSFSEATQVALGIGLCTTEAAAAGAVPLPSIIQSGTDGSSIK